MTYHGFSIPCGCPCGKCLAPMILEGYQHPEGDHYCRNCGGHRLRYPDSDPCPARDRTPTEARRLDIEAAWVSPDALARGWIMTKAPGSESETPDV